jgi:hypothetical protein
MAAQSRAKATYCMPLGSAPRVVVVWGEPWRCDDLAPRLPAMAASKCTSSRSRRRTMRARERTSYESHTGRHSTARRGGFVHGSSSGIRARQSWGDRGCWPPGPGHRREAQARTDGRREGHIRQLALGGMDPQLPRSLGTVPPRKQRRCPRVDARAHPTCLQAARAPPRYGHEPTTELWAGPFFSACLTGLLSWLDDRVSMRRHHPGQPDTSGCRLIISKWLILYPPIQAVTSP